MKIINKFLVFLVPALFVISCSGLPWEDKKGDEPYEGDGKEWNENRMFTVTGKGIAAFFTSKDEREQSSSESESDSTSTTTSEAIPSYMKTPEEIAKEAISNIFGINLESGEVQDVMEVVTEEDDFDHPNDLAPVIIITAKHFVADGVNKLYVMFVHRWPSVMYDPDDPLLSEGCLDNPWQDASCVCQITEATFDVEEVVEDGETLKNILNDKVDLKCFYNGFEYNEGGIEDEKNQAIQFITANDGDTYVYVPVRQTNSNWDQRFLVRKNLNNNISSRAEPERVTSEEIHFERYALLNNAMMYVAQTGGNFSGGRVVRVLESSESAGLSESSESSGSLYQLGFGDWDYAEYAVNNSILKAEILEDVFDYDLDNIDEDSTTMVLMQADMNGTGSWSNRKLHAAIIIDTNLDGIKEVVKEEIDTYGPEHWAYFNSLSGNDLVEACMTDRVFIDRISNHLVNAAGNYYLTGNFRFFNAEEASPMVTFSISSGTVCLPRTDIHSIPGAALLAIMKASDQATCDSYDSLYSTDWTAINNWTESLWDISQEEVLNDWLTSTALSTKGWYVSSSRCDYQGESISLLGVAKVTISPFNVDLKTESDQYVGFVKLLDPIDDKEYIFYNAFDSGDNEYVSGLIDTATDIVYPLTDLDNMEVYSADINPDPDKNNYLIISALDFSTNTKNLLDLDISDPTQAVASGQTEQDFEIETIVRIAK
jgi:hypothetical protein